MERPSCSCALKHVCEDNKTSLWKIRKILTEKSEGWLDFDNNNDIENHILSNLGESIFGESILGESIISRVKKIISRVKKEPVEIKIDDYDTGSQHKVFFGYNHESDLYYIGALRRLKELAVGDEIGLFYDIFAKNLCFSVLKQAKP